MKSEEIKTLFEKFEAIACEYQGVECWSARDLSMLLGYNKWDKFQNVIYKAREACNNAGEIVGDHFPRVGKMIFPMLSSPTCSGISLLYESPDGRLKFADGRHWNF